jgi:hypothetical protein
MAYPAMRSVGATVQFVISTKIVLTVLLRALHPVVRTVVRNFRNLVSTPLRLHLARVRVKRGKAFPLI